MEGSATLVASSKLVRAATASWNREVVTPTPKAVVIVGFLGVTFPSAGLEGLLDRTPGGQHVINTNRRNEAGSFQGHFQLSGHAAMATDLHHPV